MSGPGQQVDWEEDLPSSPSLDSWHHCPEERQSPPFCFGCGEDGHSAEDCELGKFKVCQRCGEEGHYDNQCTACPNCDEDHLPGNCPTAKVTCFLCMGNNHSPKECSMSPVIARSLKMQRLLLQSSMSFAVAHASKPEEFLDELSEKLWDKPPVISFPDFHLEVKDPFVAGSRKRKSKGHRKSQKKTPASTSRSLPALLLPWVPASQSGCPRNMADVTCFFCGQKGHYASHCPEKAVIRKEKLLQPSEQPPSLEEDHFLAHVLH